MEKLLEHGESLASGVAERNSYASRAQSTAHQKEATKLTNLLYVQIHCKAVIHQKTYGYIHSIEMMGEQTSFCERRAEELERKVDSYYKCKYAQTHVGNQYHGIVTSVVSFGLFVSIPELLIDGLIHVTELGGDYYVFDEKRHSLMGKNSGFKYVAGQELDVIIANVDMERLFIDLELVELVE